MPDDTTQTLLPTSLIVARGKADAAWEAFEEATNLRILQLANDWIDTVRWVNVKKAAFAAQDYFQAEVDKWKASSGLE